MSKTRLVVTAVVVEGRSQGEVARAAWRNRTETPTAARRRELAEHVRRVFDSSRRVFGCRRVAAQLNRDGAECSVGLVADLMRELGLKGGAAARLQARDHSRRTTGRLAGPDRA